MSRCAICDHHVGLNIAHCQKCQLVVCDNVCDDIQDKLCDGAHVHEDGHCHKCGDIYESGCTADYEVQPRQVVPA